MDISMCLNNTCSLHKNCLRFIGKPSEYIQSYADFKPEFNKKLNKEECKFFINNNKI
jgi:hypothetical protein